MGRRQQSDVDDGANVQTADLVKVGQRLRIEDGGDQRKTGIVYQHIEAAEAVDAVLHQTLGVRFDGQVGDHFLGLEKLELKVYLLKVLKINRL